MSITTKNRIFHIRENKFGNLSCRCNNGHIHRSRFEALVCNDLHFEYHKELKDGTVSIDTEVKFDLKVLGVHICNHYMDFVITFERGGREKAVEAKGFADKVWPIKKKLFEVLYPDIEYEIRYNNKTRRKN